MILRYYPTKDTTIYEKAPSTNAGIDEILEITKIPATGTTGGSVTGSYNSRILLDFDYLYRCQQLAVIPRVGV